MADMPGAATMMPPGAGTPGAGGQPPSPVAAGSQEMDSTANDGSGVLPPNAGSVPQPVKALGRQAVAFDRIAGILNILKMEAPHVLDTDASNSIQEAILKIQKAIPARESKDSSLQIMQQILQAQRGGGQGPGGPPPPPGGRPPGMPQMPMGGPPPGAPPGMTPPPVE